MRLIVTLIVVFAWSIHSSYALNGDPPFKPFPKLDITTTKTGLIIGYQQGQFSGVELGMERQWKQLKLKKPRTLAVTANAEYLFQTNNLAFRAGPWVKFGRMDFTYGADLLVASDFENTRIGASPNIGFKLIGFHVLAGYNFISQRDSFNHNSLHLSIRYFLSKSRSFDIERSNKKKKKKKWIDRKHWFEHFVRHPICWWTPLIITSTYLNFRTTPMLYLPLNFQTI